MEDDNKVPTTIRDVAAAAGVSAGTVSRVLNGKRDVADELRHRVLAAVSELGYRPNGAARSLRTRAAMVLGIVISDITNSFFTAVVRGAEDRAQEAGYSIVLANADEDLGKENRYLEIAAAEQMAGVILSPASSRKTTIDVLADRGIPVVTIDRHLTNAPVDSVTVNNHQAARDATAHLISQGCTRVGIIAGPVDTTTGASRLAGYRAALRAAGHDDDPALTAFGNFRTDGGHAAAEQLLSSPCPPDGLLISNDLMTIGGLQAIAEAGLAIPSDIAVVGFDNASWSTALRPPLTVVTQPTYEIGQTAADLLLRRVSGETFPPRRVVLRAQLIERASSMRI
ncbi:MAG: LacI family DNA-binding transcriptional regulator [Streptosporangiaceae bacterium]|nr:LacI family DNA-binding transcriptional regulator [Streptosporangiaceae bacterium]